MLILPMVMIGVIFGNVISSVCVNKAAVDQTVQFVELYQRGVNLLHEVNREKALAIWYLQSMSAQPSNFQVVYEVGITVI